MKNRKLSFWMTFVFFISLTLTNAFAQGSSQSNEIEIVFDASRSMLENAGSTTRLEAGKQALSLIANQIAPDAKVGFRAFGMTPVSGNVKESCQDSHLLIPIGPFQKDALIAQAMALQANGNTPLGFSLQEAAKDFSKGSEVKKTIILISDGAESCGVDPVGVMQNLKAQGIDVLVHAIGFDVDQDAAAQLKKIAETSGGTYADVKNAGELNKALTQVAERAQLLVEPNKQVGPHELNVLSPQNGGKLIAFSDPQVGNLIDGASNDPGKYAELNVNAEGIFGFKDGKTATISKIAIPIFQTESINPKKVEISVSETSPTSGYKTVGTFEVMNLAFAENPYQEFAFDKPVKAKFLKIKILTFQDETRSWGRISELRAIGTVNNS